MLVDLFQAGWTTGVSGPNQIMRVTVNSHGYVVIKALLNGRIKWRPILIFEVKILTLKKKNTGKWVTYTI